MYSNFVSNYLQDFNSYGHSSLEFASATKTDTKLKKPKDEFNEAQKNEFSAKPTIEGLQSSTYNHTESSETDYPQPETDDPQQESDDPQQESDDPQQESDDLQQESDDPEQESDDPQEETDEPQNFKPSLKTETPFQRDTNAIQGQVDNVIPGNISPTRAVEIIKSGTNITANLQCPHCKIIIQHPKRFLIHYKWHSFGLTNERRMTALKEIEQYRSERRKEICNERLLKQEAKDESEANFPCKDCDKVFIKNSSLKRHRLRFHPKREPVTECRICLTPVKGNPELRVHMLIHKNKDPTVLQKYQCPECPKRYKFPHSLVKHMDTHLEKTHPCPECNKLFGSPQQLQRHMKLHEKIAKGANFHCAYCGKSYYDAFTLQIHERHHTQEKPFSCEICNSAFTTNSSLQRHLKVSHNNESKPYACEYCGRCFSTEATKDRHTLRQHADPSLRPYACTMCDGRYFKAKDLRNHRYKVHPDARTSAISEND